jgi:hypothetical protein
MKRLFVGLLCAVCCLLAQSDRGTITGTVSDPAGAVVPGAVVHARNTETAAEYQTLTTATGNFALAQVPVGNYDVSVGSSGFSRYLQQGIRVAVAQSLRLDVTLQIGSTTESITVTADAPLLKTESAEQSTNVRSELINSLPLNFAARGPGSLRNPFTFVQMLPGGRIEGRNEIRINGVGGASNFGVLLEGQDQTMPLGPGNSDMHAPSVEAVQEISVQTSNFAAEYGQAASGRSTSRPSRAPTRSGAAPTSTWSTRRCTPAVLTPTTAAGAWCGRRTAGTITAAASAGRSISRRSTTAATGPSSSPTWRST